MCFYMKSCSKFKPVYTIFIIKCKIKYNDGKVPNILTENHRNIQYSLLKIVPSSYVLICKYIYLKATSLPDMEVLFYICIIRKCPFVYWAIMVFLLLNYWVFQSFDFERTRLRLFLKPVRYLSTCALFPSENIFSLYITSLVLIIVFLKHLSKLNHT